MSRIIISAVSAVAGGVFIHQKDKIIIEELENEVQRLTILVEKLKYDNNCKNKLLKMQFLKKSFDTFKDNLNKEKLELTLEPKTNDNGYLFNSESSDSFEEFDQKNEPSSASSNSDSVKSDAESSNSDDLLTSTPI